MQPPNESLAENRRRVRLVLEEAFKPEDYVFLPSDAARAAEEELFHEFHEKLGSNGGSLGQMYLRQLQRVLNWLTPGSPEFQQALLGSVMKGKRS